MPLHRYDDRPKNREKEQALIDQFLSSGATITRVPDASKMKKLRRSKAATERHNEKNNVKLIFDLSSL